MQPNSFGKEALRRSVRESIIKKKSKEDFCMQFHAKKLCQEASGRFFNTQYHARRGGKRKTPARGMEKGVAHIINHEGMTNNVPLPFTVSTHPGRMQLRKASKQQSNIWWINVLKRRLSIRWQDYITAHLKSTKSRLKADNWGKNRRSDMGTYNTDMKIQERHLPRG
jgi:hypothetical protein